MTRVLYWNIENFAINKIQNPGRKRQRGGALKVDLSSAERLTYISRHVTEMDPDIFIVVEVETPYNANRGVLCGGGGETGALALLGHLQVLDANWCLVPPLITGNKEAVAVFFRADRVTFTGPDQWNGGVGPTVPGLGAPMAQAYPPPWNNCLPVANYCAARVEFPGLVGMPPANVNFGVNVRHPYQTTFLDAGGRTINIFTVHAPANFVGATAFLQTMTTMAAIAAAGAANELRLVLGDFNLALLRVDDSTYTNCYAPFTGLANPYTVALEPAGAPPTPLLGYSGYFATHMRPRGNARCWSKTQSVAYYPSYFYTGDSRGSANESIDNVLYLAGAGGLPAAPQLTIVNGVIGSPYDSAGADPGGVPQGTEPFVRDVNWYWAGMNPQWVAPNGPSPDVAPQFNLAKGVRGWFLGWNVYGKIRSTSDHLPLFFNG